MSSALFITTMAAAGQSVAVAQSAPKTIWDGIYNKEQARRGEETYKRACSRCHNANLSGGEEVSGEVAPSLVGPYFILRWGGPLFELFFKISDGMPKDAPGTLTPQATTDIVSYLLEVNGAKLGMTELRSDMEKLKEILVTKKPNL